MVRSTAVVFAVGVVLAIVEAVQQYLHIAGWVQAVIAVTVVFLGAISIHALDPPTIAAKVPLHVATLLAALAAALNAILQLGISMPRGVHVAIGVVLVIIATVGIHATNVVSPTAALVPPYPAPGVGTGSSTGTSGGSSTRTDINV